MWDRAKLQLSMPRGCDCALLHDGQLIGIVTSIALGQAGMTMTVTVDADQVLISDKSDRLETK